MQGRLFRKHILSYGTLTHPVTGEPIAVDTNYIDRLKANFTAGVVDSVQVPLADASNLHSESPDRNIGEVVGIEDDRASGKVYALVDARDRDAQRRLGSTYLGASAFIHQDYPVKPGQRVGPSLLHVCVTNRPYVLGLEPYEEVIAASAEDSTDPSGVAVVTSEEREHEGSETGGHVPRSIDDVLAELRDDHGFDVSRDQLSALVEGEVDPELVSQVSQALSASGSQVRLTGGPSEVSQSDVVHAVAELATRNASLSTELSAYGERMAVLERENAKTEVGRLVSEGRVLPAQEATYVELAMTNRELFDKLVPDKPLVALSHESGVTPQSAQERDQEWDIDAEVVRLTAGDGPGARYFNGKR